MYRSLINNHLRVWDWEQKRPLGRFSNGNAIGSRVTGLRLINEDDQTLLMTGSSDGSVRIFKDYENRNQTKVMTAFSALPRPDPHAADYSMAMDWLQTRGEILTAGDSKSIRVWSASTELLSNVSPLLRMLLPSLIKHFRTFAHSAPHESHRLRPTKSPVT
jgi:regulator-associated protein of mTOR